MKIFERNTQEIGKSLLVTLPKQWTKGLNIAKGDSLKMVVSEQGTLLIAPEFAAKREKKEVNIHYDEHFRRRFFREYFSGNEKISIQFKKELAEKERKKLDDFLQRFMNAQVVEESYLKIVIKCFTISELSIEECLKRMHFLVLNMFEEKARTNEIRDTATRFYYILVMQVRRFLLDGKFTTANEMPLIRVLDFRMNAEKIQRIASIVSSLESSTAQYSLREEVKNYYLRIFNCFISDNYEKALLLWQEGTEKQQKMHRLLANTKSIKIYQELLSLYQIITYAKEMSMLVR